MLESIEKYFPLRLQALRFIFFAASRIMNVEIHASAAAEDPTRHENSLLKSLRGETKVDSGFETLLIATRDTK